MAISQMRFAAEVMTADEAVYKFDEIGCMIAFGRDSGLKDKALAWFVADYGTRQWLEARKASYVRSPSLDTPMGSGLAAFGERARAEEFASKVQGAVLDFEGLWK